MRDDNAKLRASGGGGGGPTSIDIERRVADLTTRNAVVEEELKNYKLYLKQNIGRYQKELKGLKGERDFWKTKAVSSGVAPESFTHA